MLVTFRNVRISIDCVESPEEAYENVCNALAALGDDIDWETDTYTTIPEDGSDVDESEPRQTSDLRPS